MSICDEILQDYNEFYIRERKLPNELHIPERRGEEFRAYIQNSSVYWKSDLLGEIKHWWYMGMRVFGEIYSFGVGWSQETEDLKRKDQIKQSTEP